MAGEEIEKVISQTKLCTTPKYKIYLAVKYFIEEEISLNICRENVQCIVHIFKNRWKDYLSHGWYKVEPNSGASDDVKNQ